jgi:hypothetical protein
MHIAYPTGRTSKHSFLIPEHRFFYFVVKMYLDIYVGFA